MQLNSHIICRPCTRRTGRRQIKGSQISEQTLVRGGGGGGGSPTGSVPFKRERWMRPTKCAFVLWDAIVALQRMVFSIWIDKKNNNAVLDGNLASLISAERWSPYVWNGIQCKLSLRFNPKMAESSWKSNPGPSWSYYALLIGLSNQFHFSLLCNFMMHLSRN